MLFKTILIPHAITCIFYVTLLTIFFVLVYIMYIYLWQVSLYFFYSCQENICLAVCYDNARHACNRRPRGWGTYIIMVMVNQQPYLVGVKKRRNNKENIAITSHQTWQCQKRLQQKTENSRPHLRQNTHRTQLTHRSNVGAMLIQRRRRWTNIGTALVKYSVFPERKKTGKKQKKTFT